MKKPAALRIVGLLVLYFAVFSFLVVLQFSRQRSFSLQAGDMTVFGRYGEVSEDGGAAPSPDGFLTEGDIRIVFGGMEFHVTASDGDFAFLRSDGEKEHPQILSLAVKDNSAVIRFAAPGIPLEVAFDSRTLSGGPGLQISASFGEEYTGLEIPFRPLRDARTEYSADGDLTVAFGGVNFAFAGPRLDPAKRVLIMNGAFPSAAYLAVSGGEGFSLGDYALASAWTQDQYASGVSRWRDQIFTAWNRTPTASLDNEELITAYLADSVQRGSYQEVFSRIPRSFLDSPRQTYLSSPFLGSLTSGSRSLSAEENLQASRFTELASGSPAEFLVGPHAFAENAVRGNDALVDRGVAALSALEAPTLDMAPVILEACVDLAAYRGDDSLMVLVEPCLSLIAEGLRKDGANDLVLVFAENDGVLTADTEFNVRLGAALDQYGRLAGREDWGAVGRSLILSVLAQTDTVGMIPAAFSLDSGGVFAAVRESRISAARLYRYLGLDNYPRAERLAGSPGSWMWTAASSVNVTQNGGITDIAVAFPAGETHYMIFRNIKPFGKIQIHGIDYRTDARFERYDSSGWYYVNSEQTLLLKLKQRDPVEHIAIYSVESAPPAPPPPTLPPVPAAEAPVPDSE